MSGQIAEAAVVAVVGIAVVLCSLTILMLATVVLMRLASSKKENSDKTAPKLDQEQVPNRESVAAIAVAVALAMQEEEAASEGRAGRIAVPQALVNRWQTAGRERLMRSRGKAGRRWRRR